MNSLRINLERNPTKAVGRDAREKRESENFVRRSSKDSDRISPCHDDDGGGNPQFRAVISVRGIRYIVNNTLRAAAYR